MRDALTLAGVSSRRATRTQVTADAGVLRAQFPVFERVSYLNAGTDGPVPPSIALSAFHSVTLASHAPDATARVLTDALGYEVHGQEGTRLRFVAPGADGLLISCGGLRTLPVERPLEESLGMPVVSSAVAGAWAAARLAGEAGRVTGATRLLSQ